MQIITNKILKHTQDKSWKLTVTYENRQKNAFKTLYQQNAATSYSLIIANSYVVRVTTHVVGR